MPKTTRTKRLVRPVKIGSKKSAPVVPTKTSKIKDVSSKAAAVATAPKKTPILAQGVVTTKDPVRFGSVSENAKIYLQEGVEALIADAQLEIAKHESDKKAILNQIAVMSDLPEASTMSEIRERQNTIIGIVKDLVAIM